MIKKITNKFTKNQIVISIFMVLAIAVGVICALGDAWVMEPDIQVDNYSLGNQKNIVLRDPGLIVSETDLEGDPGEEFEIIAEANMPVYFEILDDSIADVYDDGYVELTGAGETRIKVYTEANSTYEKAVAYVNITVNEQNQKITGCKGKYHLDKDESVDLKAKAKTLLKYESSDPAVATVDADGNVTGISKGNAVITITAQSDDYMYGDTTRKVKIVVEEYSEEDRMRMAREAAVKWAIEIADDNTFHYGRSKWAHHHGCYFCNTNQPASSPKRKAGGSLAQVEKTYCCNPFVTAAFAHGAEAPEVDCRDSSKRINLANDKNPALNNEEAFKRISKPAKVTDLEVGDVLLTPTHAMLYAGEGKVVEAAHHDNGKKDSYWNDSIRLKTLNTKQWKRTSKIYRYIGQGKFAKKTNN